MHASAHTNYGPISILSLLDKIFEKLIYQTMLDHVGSYIYKSLFGFRKGCGTDEAVVSVLNYIGDKLDHGFRGVAGLVLNFTKAFDLQKIKHYGVLGKDLQQIDSICSKSIQISIQTHVYV